jgi:hypothetical protein
VGALWCVRVPTDGQLPMREMWFGDEVEAQARAEYVVPVRCQLLGELQRVRGRRETPKSIATTILCCPAMVSGRWGEDFEDFENISMIGVVERFQWRCWSVAVSRPASSTLSACRRRRLEATD